MQYEVDDLQLSCLQSRRIKESLDILKEHISCDAVPHGVDLKARLKGCSMATHYSVTREVYTLEKGEGIHEASTVLGKVFVGKLYTVGWLA